MHLRYHSSNGEITNYKLETLNRGRDRRKLRPDVHRQRLWRAAKNSAESLQVRVHLPALHREVAFPGLHDVWTQPGSWRQADEPLPEDSMHQVWRNDQVSSRLSMIQHFRQIFKTISTKLTCNDPSMYFALNLRYFSVYNTPFWPKPAIWNRRHLQWLY